MALMSQFDNGSGIDAWAERGLIAATAEGEKERLQAVAQAWRYYRGDHAPALKTRRDEPDDNVTVNVVATVIDALTDFVFGESLTLSLEGVEPADPAQEYIDTAWQRSGGMRLLGDLRTNGGVAGHAFAWIDVVEGQFVRESPPRIRPIDPGSVTPILHEDDPSKVVEWRIAWNVYRDGHIIAKRRRVVSTGLAWEIVTEESDGRSGGRWKTTDVSPWAYEWPPIAHCKNLPRPGGFWGSPDATPDLIRLQDAVNASASNARRVSRLLGHSQVWATGVNASDDLSADPGEALILPDEARIGVIGPANTPTAHLELLRELRGAFHDQSRVPRIAMGNLDGVGAMSGVALRILYGPLARKVAVVRGLYGELIESVNRRLLALADFPDAGTLPRWQDVVPVDPREEGEAAVARQEAGVSRQTTLQEMGLDAEDEAKQRAVEREDDADAELANALRRFDAGGDETG